MACWQELFCSQASVTLFGTVTHGWRTHTLTTADLVTRMGPGGVTSPSMCSDVTYVWLNLFVPLYFWLWFAAFLSLIHIICLVLFERLSDFCKVCDDGGKRGQVTKEEVSYPFSVISVFLNCWHHSGAFREWVPGQVQFPASCSVSSLCVCAFSYSWISALSGEVEEMSLQTE